MGKCSQPLYGEGFFSKPINAFCNSNAVLSSVLCRLGAAGEFKIPSAPSFFTEPWNGLGLMRPQRLFSSNKLPWANPSSLVLDTSRDGAVHWSHGVTCSVVLQPTQKVLFGMVGASWPTEKGRRVQHVFTWHCVPHRALPGAGMSVWQHSDAHLGCARGSVALCL